MNELEKNDDNIPFIDDSYSLLVLVEQLAR
jgi:hypothetical protein